MHTLKINGGKTLTGTITISGAKNSVVALIPAAILSDESVQINNIPKISDVNSLEDILDYLNIEVESSNKSISMNMKFINNKTINESMTKKLRASYYFMGALLGKFGYADMYLPGGCLIGERPIDQHLKGFKALGAKIKMSDNKITLEAKNLKGAKIFLDCASVGATINLMLAAVKAKGETTIENAAKEPEIVNVANLLNSMGARIKGAGTDVINISGVDYLHSGCIDVIPDRIEAGTYMIIGACCGNNLRIENIIPKHDMSLIEKLEEMNIPIEVGDDYVVVSKPNEILPTSIQTVVYPGFPTDLQQVISSLMTMANGVSKIKENLYENRFNNLYEIEKMGAKIRVEDKKAYIMGPTKLKGQEIIATDLRASAGLVTAALIAEGTTMIKNVDYILRGYEDIVGKLKKVGADIELL